MPRNPEELERIAPPEGVRTRARIKSLEQYQEMYRRSVEDPGGFWEAFAE
jgi:hypothetical protein